MTKAIRIFLLFSIVHFSGQAQVISQFNWNSNPVTQAVTGPNGISVSGTATSSAGGSGGTNGLNPGLGRNEIALIVPGAVFEQPGLDISVDFARQENAASFIMLGGLDFGISGGSIYVKFVLRQGGSDVTVNLNNKLVTPTDVNFHNYRFLYDNVSGKVSLFLDGAPQYTAQQAPAGTPLSWTGATNVTIGSGLDGSNTNVPVLDNLLVKYPPILLPLQLLSFDAQSSGSGNELSWTTASEVNTQEFVIESSPEGVTYQSIGVVSAGKSVTGNNDYRFVDAAPSALCFYRLKMVDIDGNFSYSPVKVLSSAAGNNAVSIRCYPNPVVDQVNIRIDRSSSAGAPYYYTVMTADGKILQSGIIGSGGAGQSVSLSLGAAPKGILLLRVQAGNEVKGVQGATAQAGAVVQAGAVQVFKILKQ